MVFSFILIFQFLKKHFGDVDQKQLINFLDFIEANLSLHQVQGLQFSDYLEHIINRNSAFPVKKINHQDRNIKFEDKVKEFKAEYVSDSTKIKFSSINEINYDKIDKVKNVAES